MVDETVLTPKQVGDIFGAKLEEDGTYNITYTLGRKVNPNELTIEGARNLTVEIVRVLAQHMEEVRHCLMLIKPARKAPVKSKRAPAKSKKAKRK